MHLLSQTQMTGTETYLQTLVHEHLKMGHQIWIASDKLHVAMPGTFVSLPISKKDWTSNKTVKANLTELIQTQKIELIHCHSRAAVRHGHRLATQFQLPMLTSVHGDQHYSLSKRLRDIYGQLVVTNCHNLSLSMIHKFRTSPSKMRLLHNPVDPRKFEFNYSANKKNRMAFIGRSTGPKGERLREILRLVWPSIAADFPEIHLDLILTQADEFLNSLNGQLPERVRVLKHQTDLAKLYGDYDLIIGSGRVAIEAALMGTPVICLGEALYEGVLQRKGFQQQIQSNFGDMRSYQEAATALWTATEKQVAGMQSDLSSLLRQKPEREEQLALRNRLIPLVDPTETANEFIELYEQARFLLHHPANIPILMYHKVPNQTLKSRHQIFVTKKDFEKHLSWFQKWGMTSLFLSELKDFLQGRKPMSEFPKKPLILTFDDGYADNLENAAPLLLQYNMKANIFLLADTSIKKNTWDLGDDEPEASLLSPQQRQDIAAQGCFEIGSHGYQHLDLTSQELGIVRHQLVESKTLLEKEFGKNILALVYPFGKTNQNLSQLAENCGYFFAFNTDSGGRHWLSDRHSIFRANVFPNENRFGLWKKTRSWYRQYFFFKRKI